MFKNRNNDRKPDKGLINRFQANFSGIMKTTSESVLDRSVNPKDLQRNNATQLTPELRFTPFLDDQSLPNSTADRRWNKSFGTFNTGLHGFAGDLHTPTLQSNLLTPETLLNHYTDAVTPLHRNKVAKASDPFDLQSLAPEVHNYFCEDATSAKQPNTFAQPDAEQGLYNGTNGEIPVGNLALNGQIMSGLVDGENIPDVEKLTFSHNTNFRYKVSLTTPTAMIQGSNDIPITYLNKGQTYPLTIIDSKPPSTQNGLTHYRTSIRITFDTTEHTSNPNSCWSLWKASSAQDMSRKSRVMNAVELANLGQNQGQTNNFHVEKTSLDGFSIKWFTDASGIPACTLGIRFNFLSTDFSYSKGVKGSPLRLLAKTETITPDIPELSYCKVKVFRDHGAERKMFTDVSQLKRAIEKRKEEYIKALSGAGENLGKRKRGSRIVENNQDGAERAANLQNDLDAELADMHRAFSSNLPISEFCLPGDVQDDPDLFPIQLSDEETQIPRSMPQPVLNNLTPPSTLDSESRTSNLSQSPTNQRTPKSTGKAAARSSSSIKDTSPTGDNISFQNAYMSTSASTERLVPKKNEAEGGESGSGDKPTCLYIRFQNGDKSDDFHTALFLQERTAQCLKMIISQKRNFSADLEVELYQVKENGLKVRIDDDVVQQISNDQAMSAEISEPLPSDNSTQGEGMRAPGTIEVRLYF
ncbi:hypothetical protein N7478_003840 [Penicillium angulare]|uniref:uncharacterized protein n=1 Tax=Penicillium angulare TaxID=116970 RepID=UPI0025408627|nr:uncharacterized protein N7478_003840 [Penicillium angulare]KAJ5288154.1 hypothetical protein N7478_003840 [Penicillium angulare]